MRLFSTALADHFNDKFDCSIPCSNSEQVVASKNRSRFTEERERDRERLYSETLKYKYLAFQQEYNDILSVYI